MKALALLEADTPLSSPHSESTTTPDGEFDNLSEFEREKASLVGAAEELQLRVDKREEESRQRMEMEAKKRTELERQNTGRIKVSLG